jgi:drug/metabolite transporter (DMT)-like permease
MGVAYAGVLLVFLHDVRVDGRQALLGSTVVFMAAITYAIYLMLAGEIVNRVGSLRLVAYASASSTVFCVLQALVSNPLGMITQAPEVYGLSLLNASLCTFVPMLLIMAAVKQVGSGLAAQAGVMGPVATVFLGWYFLDEPIGPLQAIGVVVVLASMGMLWTLTRTSGVAASGDDQRSYSSRRRTQN